MNVFLEGNEHLRKLGTAVIIEEFYSMRRSLTTSSKIGIHYIPLFKKTYT